MKNIFPFLFSFCLLCNTNIIAQTNPTPQALPYTQNFSVFSGSATAYPDGWQGWTIAGSTSTSHPTAVPSGDQVLASGTAAQNSAVSAFVGDAVGKIAFLNTSSAKKCFVLSVNTTNNSNIQVSYDAGTQRQQTTARKGGIALEYRVGHTDTFVVINSSEYQNDNAVDNTAGNGAINTRTINVTLPSICDNQSEVQLRWTYREVSGSGNRPGFSVTNVSVNPGVPNTTPTLYTTPNSLNFGNVNISNSSTLSFALSGLNLTSAPGVITIASSSADFQVSTDGVNWSASSTVSYTSATLSSTQVFVRFTPQSSGVKSSTIIINGGGISSSISVSVSGTGLIPPPPPTPSLSASTTNNNFGYTTISDTSIRSFLLSGSLLTQPSQIVISSSNTSFLISIDGFSWKSIDSFSINNASLAPTLIYVKYSPTSLGADSSNISVNGGGASTSIKFYGIGSQSKIATSTDYVSFGFYCVNQSLVDSIVINGTNLHSPDSLKITGTQGYKFSTFINGSFADSLVIPVSSLNTSLTLYVQFSPIKDSSYLGSIHISGARASSRSISLSGTGIKKPVVITGSVSQVDTLSNHVVTMNATIGKDACFNIVEYGFEYYTTLGWIRRVISNNRIGYTYSSVINNLVQNTNYNYRAYAIAENSSATKDTIFGEVKQFITPKISNGGLVIYNNPYTRGLAFHFTLSGIEAGNYGIQFINSLGQVAYQKNVYVQSNDLINSVGFMDYHFTLPMTVTPGLYSLQIANPNFRIVKKVLVQ